MDTIFALATARGRAGIAVIRVSGVDALATVKALCGSIPEPRRASLRRLEEDGRHLDDALVIVFPEGESFTGESSVEYQIHGGYATVQAVLGALARLPGLRLAEPGEFTRRALENGNLDLTQVEGLADLIDAETESQHRQAMAVLSGALGQRASEWRAQLMRALALLNATIDFSDEDVPEEVGKEVSGLIDAVGRAIDRELAGSGAAERIRDGFEVAIVGAPNVGKSTLLNALAGRDAAITSDVAGTTRDIIEVRMTIAGLSVTLLDTAGLRESSDAIEQIGISRSLDRADRADLRVFLRLGDEELPILPKEGDLVVHAKSDITPAPGPGVSGVTGEGLEELIGNIGSILESRVAGASLAIRERHRQSLIGSLRSLRVAQEGLAQTIGVELVAEDLRAALQSLELLIGKVGVEDLLDEIFSRFCIGK